jgi:hypothetical protein
MLVRVPVDAAAIAALGANVKATEVGVIDVTGGYEELGYNLQYLQLQDQMQNANRAFTVVSKLFGELSSAERQILPNVKALRARNSRARERDLRRRWLRAETVARVAGEKAAADLAADETHALAGALRSPYAAGFAVAPAARHRHHKG